MSLSIDDVKKIAHLARLNVADDALAQYTEKLSHILEFVDQMNQVDTSHAEAVAHSLDVTQRLRPDEITEHNQRDAFQKVAPKVEAGLYLVPVVIE